MTSRDKKLFIALFIGLCMFSAPAFGAVEGAVSADSLREMTRDSGIAYPDENRAVASGVGLIKEDNAQEIFLARRAALLDARRNLLALRRKLLDGSAPRNLSGHVFAHKVFGERVEGNLYFLEVEVSIDALLHPDFRNSFFILQK